MVRIVGSAWFHVKRAAPAVARALALVLFVGAGAGLTVCIWALHPAPVVYPALYGGVLGYIVWNDRTRPHNRH